MSEDERGREGRGGVGGWWWLMREGGREGGGGCWAIRWGVRLVVGDVG